MADDLLRQVIAAAMLRIEQRLDRIEAAISERNFAPADHADQLEDALCSHFAPGEEITAAVVLRLVDADPYGAVGEAVAALVNLNGDARSRSTAVGVLLSGLHCLQLVGERRGAARYILRT